MTEAWLLVEAAAIRKAADNPNGSVHLALPPPRDLEGLPDPKQKLNEFLRDACGLHGRRMDQFRRDESSRRVRVAEFIEDFSPLLRVSAFQQFQRETLALLNEQGWLKDNTENNSL